MSKKIIKIFSFLTAFSLLFSPLSALAENEFNPEFIISDEEMRDTTGWTRGDVQKFLTSKGSYLASYFTVNQYGLLSKAADIIYDAAINNHINPKFLLVTLQKEQSLITDKSPSAKQLDWATGYAVCDGCWLSDPKVQKHKGFTNQVENAAGLIDWYYNNKDVSFVKKMGQTIKIDNEYITPQTWATAFLYTYTPHFHGNENFWKLWNNWFAQTYPNGTILQSADNGDVWLIQNGKKRKFKNKAVLLSRANPEMIITIPESELANYKEEKEISFPNYSILKSSGKYYLLDFDTLRPFASAEVVRQIGYNPQEIIEVNSGDLIGYTIGSVITADIKYAKGAIFEIIDTGDYYLFKDEILHPILQKEIIQANYKDLPVEQRTSQDLKNYKIADIPAQFQDGALLQSELGGKIYVMENGKKRRFADEKTFLAMGYKKENIIKLPEVALFTTLSGDPIHYTSDSDLSEYQELNQISALAGYADEAKNIRDLYGSALPSYVVAEYPSGKIISGKNIDQQRPIASLTKIFVGYEALEQNLDQSAITIYDPAKHPTEGYSLALNKGQKMTNKDLLNTMLIGSYNNIAHMVVGATGLSESSLLKKINGHFKEWGANNSSLADATGLSEKNVSTARDLVKIITHSLETFDIKNILGKERHDFTGIGNGKKFSIATTNKLDFDNSDYKIISGKTGYTNEAQSVLFLLIQSKKTSQKYLVITLGDPDYARRFVQTDKIAKWIANKDKTWVAQETEKTLTIATN